MFGKLYGKIFAYEKIKRVLNVNNSKYFQKKISNTFHGRDIFAPVAANIVNGLNIKNIGVDVKPYTKPEKFLDCKKNVLNGKIIYIDNFGNLITNILCNNYSQIHRLKSIKVGKYLIKEFKRTYSDMKSARPYFLIGSSGLIEVSIPNENAAFLLKISVGEKVIVQLHE